MVALADVVYVETRTVFRLGLEIKIKERSGGGGVGRPWFHGFL